MKSDLELLQQIYKVASVLDLELCTVLNRGKSTMSGAEYEELMELMIEVEDYLEAKDL
ncbi:hypothetical protein L8C07_05845 [Paenibacillus sp. CMAA1739]|uniref:hypothetical protein n=1 Tax=Paenibacillus ottowii TaxID=2315729 RepID=UPI002DB5930E|nr:hypothetical protein [Paenibacillus sp. CMAA1739]MEC4565461.1 hypothetical protein [Paenibacillus sp. CMAA1739]